MRLYLATIGHNIDRKLFLLYLHLTDQSEETLIDGVIINELHKLTN